MTAIRVHRLLESDTLRLPELKELIGKNVEILVTEEPAARPRQSGEMPDYSALTRIAGQDLIDPDVYKDLRAASMT